MAYAQIHRVPTSAVLGSGMGLYTMADYTIWTSSEVADEIRRFANEVSGTNGDVGTHRNALIAAGSSGSQFWTDWQIFMRDWAAYQAHRAAVGPAAFGTSSTSAIVDLRALVNRYNTLEERYRSLTGIRATARSGDTRPPGFHLPFSDTLGTGGSIGLMVAAGLGVVSLVALAVLATQARAFAAPALAMRRNRRRRRVR